MLRFNAISEKKKKEVVKENQRFFDEFEGTFLHCDQRYSFNLHQKIV